MVARFLIALFVLVPITVLAAAPPLSRGVLGLDAAAGWALFRRPWISSPSSLVAGGGVGPLYTSRTCESCHAGGGPGRIAADAIGAGMVVRTGRADATGDPVYGSQIQTQALPGFEPEADVTFRWQTANGLRTADIVLSNLHYGPLARDTHEALRRAPSLFGIGRLEAIPEKEILVHAGRGRPAWITDSNGKRKLGRFGWKATQPEMTTQIANAFQRDFGIGTSDFPGAYGECTHAETACRAVGGPNVELPDQFRDLIATYLRTLYPPDSPNEASPGFALFRKSGCMECHAVLKDAQGQPVHAYSDLVLHDMGPGLDDGIAEGGARSSEWRTAPLWDVADSLSQGGLLHDGRARSIDEAVAWHGGEASQARTAFNALSSKDRNMLDDFLLGH
jgi:CxxC motif-containing protein (DUF1111 family)